MPNDKSERIKTKESSKDLVTVYILKGLQIDLNKKVSKQLFRCLKTIIRGANNEKKLCVYEPIINTYPGYGLLFSITGNDEKVLEWIYCNFVQINVLKHKKLDYFFMCFSDHDFVIKNCPCIKSYLFPENMVHSMFNNSYVEFLKHCLNSNMYVSCLLNYSVIKSTNMNGLHTCFFMATIIKK